jgi:hypothetical protein
MALKFIDSFDHYLAVASGAGSEQASWKWTSASYHRREPGVHGYGMAGVFQKGMRFGSTTVIMEMYIQPLVAGSLFTLRDTNQVTQISCSYTLADGTIEVNRYGSNPAVDRIFQSDPDLIRLNTWYHFAWKVFIHPSAGTVEVRLNGETICNLTGIQTTATTLPWSGAIGSFIVGDNGNATVFDDLVVMDDVDDGLNDPRLPGGGGFDKFLGAVEIVVKRPNAVGTSAEWTPAPAGANWMNVDDIEPDGDTSVNSAAATANGATDLFAMEDLLVTQDVVGAQSLICCRKTEEGFAAVSRVVKDGGTATVGTPFYLPDSYSYLITPEPTLPDGTLWSRTRWNAIEYGYRRMA